MSEEPHPTKVCTKCGKECTRAEFANKREWRRAQPSCRLCMEEAEQQQQQPKQTKSCAQCNKQCEKDQFPKKEWKKEHPLCRLCFEFTHISDEQTRQCKDCALVLPRNQYSIYQWEKGEEALCHDCQEVLSRNAIASMDKPTKIKNLPDGTSVCSLHSMELCDICMMDFTLPNRFARMRTLLGRDLSPSEYEEQTKLFQKDANMQVNRKICILDGQVMCPRSGFKLRCPCNEVTYCSKICQKYHWTIHKMTCKVHLAKAKKKKDKADRESQAALVSAKPAHGLSEE